MLKINGLKYAKNDSEFTSTLFDASGTAYGFYKILKNRILLSDMQRKIFAAIICNENFTGIVNAVKIDGKIFYQYAASAMVEKRLGIPEGYSQSKEYAKKIYDEATKRGVSK